MARQRRRGSQRGGNKPPSGSVPGRRNRADESWQGQRWQDNRRQDQRTQQHFDRRGRIEKRSYRDNRVQDNRIQINQSRYRSRPGPRLGWFLALFLVAVGALLAFLLLS